ncbi:YpfB family protein [Bacillus dakarensis]|uniref:YpfB family protein n=1 Tax=Robertmurraya dakarensis TaxID=1926278 RepID=UPI0009809354|nr:YpfB family protein [Bacillus dakarensis]
MKTIERIIIKIIIVQFVFLLVTQFFFHRLNTFPELKEITQYEGVTENNFSELLQVFNGSQDKE